MRLTIRNVALDNAPVDVAIEGGRIAAIGPRLDAPGETIDGRGGALIGGLHDHHLHLLALAARRSSVGLEGLIDASAVAAALQAAPGDGWVRAVDYDERAAGVPDRAVLDGWMRERPVRLADRTGALRVLNSRALAELSGQDLPPGAERDADGRPTGRFWREDAWLARALPGAAPPLAPVGAMFARLGVTALTDATAHNGADEAALLSGAVTQRLTLMGNEGLRAGAGYALGPLKLLFDERDPPPVDALAARITTARGQGRAVAAHCVTYGELALFLAALALAGGALDGDRIEHGAMIPAAMIADIAASGLTVVPNPGFIHARGDRYLATVGEGERADLIRLGSLAEEGVRLRGGSDAPYGPADPWVGMRAARDRMTAAGARLGAASERLSAEAALALYGGQVPSVGDPGDVIICDGSAAEVLRDLDAERVRATIVGGVVAWSGLAG